MNRQLSIPAPGQLVEVRRRRYAVVDITPSVPPTDTLTLQTWHPQHLLTLSSLEDDALGEELQALWEIEPGTQIIEKTPLPHPDCLSRLTASVIAGADAQQVWLGFLHH